MNNNNYKWETVGKSKFYTDGTTCTDIEVMDNAKTVSFIYPKIRINREKCQKVPEGCGIRERPLGHGSGYCSLYGP